MNLKDRGLTLPIAMGHEIVGRVVKLGPDAKGVKLGDIRIVFPWLGCGTCAACLAEEDNMCLVPKSLGVYQHGGYATHVVAPHPRHLVDPGTIDPAVAATYACSGITVFSAIKKVMPLPPDEPHRGRRRRRPRPQRHRRPARLEAPQTRGWWTSAPKSGAAAEKAGATQTVDGTGEGVHRKIIAACGAQPAAIIDLVNGNRHRPFRVDSLRKGGKTGSGRPVRRRTFPPLAADGHPRAHRPGQLRRQPKELRELVGPRPVRRPAAAAGGDRAHRTRPTTR